MEEGRTSCELDHTDPLHVNGITSLNAYPRRHRNVVLMGQFNWEMPTDNVLFWVQKWGQVFHHVEVRGPFPNKQLQELRCKGVNAYYGNKDKGFYSPIENLIKSLELHSNNGNEIEGVLYIHDDGLLNMTVFRDIDYFTTLGLETNFTFGEKNRTSFLLMPQVRSCILTHISSTL